MTDIEKNLVKIDLCGRLPYNVKVHAKYTDIGETIELDGIVKMIDDDGVVGIEVINDFSSAWTYAQIDNIKPYLFPLSSMTERQCYELSSIRSSFQDCWKYIKTPIPLSICNFEQIEWFHKNHFDYRGLIEKSLALDATNLGIYE